MVISPKKNEIMHWRLKSEPPYTISGCLISSKFMPNLGGYECYCWEGFEGTGVFGDCHNIDECSYYEMADGGEGQD